MNINDVERNAREIARQTIEECLHAKDKELEEKVYIYAQTSIQILLKEYIKKILYYEDRINIIKNDMDKLYDNLINNNNEMTSYELTRRGYKAMCYLSICYVLGVIDHKEMIDKRDTINMIIPNALQNKI